MKNIFIGFLLIFLDFNLNLGNSTIGLIPDFIGYTLMINGLSEMKEESLLFTKIQPYATGMAVYAGILYFLDIIGFSTSTNPSYYILAIISTIISLYISYKIIMGIIEMESKYNTFLNGTKLRSIWNILAVFNVLTFLSLFIPIFAIACIIVTFIIAIYFLVAFNYSKNLYYEMKNQFNTHFV